ncbi:MAG: hypothetical protein ACYCYD_02635 [Acidimicrobiales bacterium]
MPIRGAGDLDDMFTQTIVMTCPICGDVEVPAACLGLEVPSLPAAPPAPGAPGTLPASRVGFLCPSCGAAVSWPARPGVFDFLVRAGTPLHWRPEDLGAMDDSPPLSVAEILRFRRFLASADVLKRLAIEEGVGLGTGGELDSSGHS